jgi:hypothetical protein
MIQVMAVTKVLPRSVDTNALQLRRLTVDEIIFLVEDAPEGGYCARALGYSIFTEGDTWSELSAAVRDAVACHFDSPAAPRVIRLHLVREEVIPA